MIHKSSIIRMDIDYFFKQIVIKLIWSIETCSRHKYIFVYCRIILHYPFIIYQAILSVTWIFRKYSILIWAIYVMCYGKFVIYYLEFHVFEYNWLILIICNLSVGRFSTMYEHIIIYRSHVWRFYVNNFWRYWSKYISC